MEETPDRSGNSGMSGLKVVFFFPLLPEEDIIKVVVGFFLFIRGGEAGKKGFQPMRKKLGEKFGVVFSFAVVVTDMELFGLIEGVLTKAADLLAKGGVLRSGTGGAEVVGGFGVERVDGGGHGRVLILECVDVLA